MNEQGKEIFTLISRFGTIGLEMGLSVVIGLIMGHYLDTYLGSSPWMTIVFLLFGIAAGFKALLRTVKESQRHDG